MTKEELAIKYNVSIEDIEKAFRVSDSEFEVSLQPTKYRNYTFTNVPTGESLCEHWYGDSKLPPVWRTE